MGFKYLGVLNEEIAKYWGIEEHKNKPIVVYDDRREHVIERHLEDFGSVERIDMCYHNLGNIIKKHDYVFYNENSKSLEFYKKINEDICVAVRISPGKILKVRSWFPANKGKINNRRKKEEDKILSEENL